MAPSRPFGVTLIAVLQLLGSLALLFAGLGLLVGGSLIAGYELGIAGGAFILLFAIIGFVIFLGLWRGRSWAWYLMLIFTLISVLGMVGTLVMGSIPSILGVVVDIVILYYLFRPNVKSFFNI